ncbi:GLUG motif-containing protein [Aquabacterium sp.]|uniref:two-partner secretion domain-containing protein n=1 Tax=Aquabacterium sp. TaxID=1872578 RepID=UPI002488C7BC|nr:GLUG motif-containing protein [Aquabacterium sp.]MDI1261263.1 filamentous hemagglutinin N-terminal domain-containing protein [Aquabacterium sp.]
MKKLTPLVASAALLTCAAASATDLPTGGQIITGSGSLTTDGTTLTITQTSATMAADWQGFSIGLGHTVHFIQPSANAVALNRVLGTDVSVIQGALIANGLVFLINPNGVLFTPTAQVNVGGLVASTLSLSTADFMAGRYQFAGTSSNAIVNQGRITTANGGTIALIAARITNTGSLVARQGQVLMGAGSRVTLDLGGPVKIQVSQGALDALITQGGAIKADGGLVYLTAKAAGDLATTVINHTGVTEAQTLASGETGQIYLMGGMDTDRMVVGGTLDASAPHGGDGGFVETSAAHVALAADLQVSTLAANGHTGTWLIDPQDFTIAASGGDITGAQLTGFLASTNVTIESSSGGAAGHGDIHVNDAASWSAHELTLTAARDINLNAVLTASGTSSLVMNTGTTNGNDGGNGDGAVKVGFAPGEANGFAGRVDFAGRAGSGLLTINGNAYTVINSLGNAGSSTATDLQGMGGNLSGFYALGSDIDASATAAWNGGQGFTPVGNASTAFTGQFDGLGHTIDHLTFNNPASNNLGLIGKAFGAVIRNVGLTNAQVTGNDQVGPLMGEAVLGLLHNSYATGGQVSGHDQVGGLVGANNTMRVNDSHAANTVNGHSMVGGLMGWTNGGTNSFRNHALGNVTGTGLYVGGLVGHNDFAYSLHSSHASGNVTGAEAVGGLVGYNTNGDIRDSFASGTVTSTGNQAGGLVGLNRGTIDGSHATGNVSGNANQGGLAGINEYIVTNSYATGTVTGTGILVGGLTGQNNGHLLNSYATGAVSGPGYVGGLTGYSNSFIANTYATGSVTSTGEEVGGLVGHLGGTLVNSYSTGAVSSPGVAVGGLAGFADSSAPNNNFWDVSTSGQSTSADGSVGLTTAEMKQRANFTSAGWDFNSSWVMYEGHTTPLLRTFMTALTVTANNASKTYDGTAYSGAPGVSYSQAPDMSQVLGTVVYDGDYQGATQVGSYTVTPDGLYSGQQGYLISLEAGTVTIAARPITVTADAQSKTYGNTDPTLTYQITTGSLVGSDALSGSLSRTTGEDVGDYAISAGDLSNGNYLITAQDGMFTILQRLFTQTPEQQAAVTTVQAVSVGPSITTPGTPATIPMNFISSSTPSLSNLAVIAGGIKLPPQADGALGDRKTKERK